MKFKIDEWDRRHPGHLRANRNMLEIIPTVTDLHCKRERAQEHTSIAPTAPIALTRAVHSDITLTADISDSRLTAISRIRAIEHELAQLRGRTRVTPIAPHSAYRASESLDVSNHDANPTIIFQQSA